MSFPLMRRIGRPDRKLRRHPPERNELHADAQSVVAATIGNRALILQIVLARLNPFGRKGLIDNLR